MARLSTIGFETADLSEIARDITVPLPYAHVLSPVYTGAYALGCSAAANLSMPIKNGTTSAPGIYLGCWINLASTVSPIAHAPLLGFYGLQGAAPTQVGGCARVCFHGDGALELIYFDHSYNPILAGVSSLKLATDTWYHLQFHIYRSATVGVIELRINGSLVAEASEPLDLNPPFVNSEVTAYIGDPLLTGLNPGIFFLDDIVVNDSAGSADNSWPGLLRLYPLYPSATVAAGLTNSSGTQVNNHTYVDDLNDASFYRLKDDDITYVQGATINIYDDYNLTHLTVPEGGIVKAVTGIGFMRQTAGTATKGQVGLSTTSDQGSQEYDLTSVYRPYVFRLVPATGSFNQTQLDAMKLRLGRGSA